MNHWKMLKASKPKHRLLFIHSPKCGGTYVKQILKDLGIKTKGHRRATIEDNKTYITFTVIRDPVERFESLLNYRLGESKPRNDWPNRLKYLYHNKSYNLNDVVNRFNDKELLGFMPYGTLVYWCKNVDIIITLDQLHDLLKCFGYDYDKSKYMKRNVSIKNRGSFNDKSKRIIKNVFSDDVRLYNSIRIAKLLNEQ